MKLFPEEKSTFHSLSHTEAKNVQSNEITFSINLNQNHDNANYNLCIIHKMHENRITHQAELEGS